MSREESRWTYAMGSRPEGVIIYDGGAKLHSHHDTDPARGQHNAFDLVRLHKFGALDKAVPPGTPITEPPSFKAMAEFAASLPEVAAQQAVEEFEELPPRTPEELAMGAKRAAVPAQSASSW